jgi:hypothetical protein
MLTGTSLIVMPGLDPGSQLQAGRLDCRVEPGNDQGRRPCHER